MELTLHQTIEKESHKTYGQVNRMWPDKIPPITKEEALKAYKLLTRKFGSKEMYSDWQKKFVKKQLYAGRRRPRRCWICLSGNCNTLSRGWRRLVHDISHRVYDFRFPQSSRDHNIAQAKIEQEMAQYVIGSGWLEGKLKSKPKEKHKEDVILNRFARMLKREKVWERKLKLATSHLKKVKREIKVYKRRHNKVSVN